MAIYEYTCRVCGESEQFVRSITDPARVYMCKTCNVALKRVYSNVGVTFNGNGFYSTDK